jgi:glycosyltransferase involved in cell wall biosynthesis
MKNRTITNQSYTSADHTEELSLMRNDFFPLNSKIISKNISVEEDKVELTEILFITSYPPRECGIATYSHDLIKAINNKFSNSFSIRVCALETSNGNHSYPDEVKFVLNTSSPAGYKILATKINNDGHIKMVLIQHEFGFFKLQEQSFVQFLSEISKPVVIVFHTVLPHPDSKLKSNIKSIADYCESVIVMTQNSSRILTGDYDLQPQKISVIAHGTHLIQHLSKGFLKKKYGLAGRKVLTTFGLLSSGKSIETTLEALPAIISTNPEVVFLIIGKTHPEVVKVDGEKYRRSLETLVIQKKLTQNVIFINSYLALPNLLEYLQLTDIYLFTTNDPNQAVSGTFVYAMSCGCPIISTPIPHAKEVLTEDTGITFDFCNSEQLSGHVIRLLNDEPLRRKISINTLQKIVSTAWENSAVSHAVLFEKIACDNKSVHYNIPEVNMSHLKLMTTDIGIIQFSKINQPDINSGYTLDDNARALIACCMYYKLTGDKKIIYYLFNYLNFIKLCLQPGGDLLNYFNSSGNSTRQNSECNLDDANGRAVWALGYFISEKDFFSEEIISKADAIIRRIILHVETVHSPRAMAFAIKGLYYYYKVFESKETLDLIRKLADRLVRMYKHESKNGWEWFESYLTYANSILPEAMIYTWLLTGEIIYRDIAKTSFDFLLSKIFNENGIEVISNRNWLQKGQQQGNFGEQPIDVAYTILTLSIFYDTFREHDYLLKIETAFNWFLGKNRLQQIIYNSCTGGCYDGLEETHVNLNQGAESTLSYLMARLTVEKYRKPDENREADSLVDMDIGSGIEDTISQSVMPNYAIYSS